MEMAFEVVGDELFSYLCQECSFRTDVFPPEKIIYLTTHAVILPLPNYDLQKIFTSQNTWRMQFAFIEQKSISFFAEKNEHKSGSITSLARRPRRTSHHCLKSRATKIRAQCFILAFPVLKQETGVYQPPHFFLLIRKYALYNN